MEAHENAFVIVCVCVWGGGDTWPVDLDTDPHLSTVIRLTRTRTHQLCLDRGDQIRVSGALCECWKPCQAAVCPDAETVLQHGA